MKRTGSGTRKHAGILVYGAVLLLALLYALPFVFAASTSLKTPGQIMAIPFEWIPDPLNPASYLEAWRIGQLGTPLRNTAIITFFSMLGIYASAPLVAYGFAKIPFTGRRFWFILMLSTMMLPVQITIIPLYVIYRSIGWLDTYLPLIVPAFFGGSAFYMFLLRQFFLTIPVSLDEASIIDGCSRFRIFASVYLPLSRPVMATVGIFAFVLSWNDYFRPLIFLSSSSKYPITVALAMYRDLEGAIQYNNVMAATLIGVAPCIAVFLVFQRYFVQGISTTGMKA